MREACGQDERETFSLTELLSLLSFLELAHYGGPELGAGTLAAWAAADRVGVGGS